MSRSILDFRRPQFSLDLSLYFLPFMQPDIARRRLRARLLILDKLSGELEEMIQVRSEKEPVALTISWSIT